MITGMLNQQATWWAGTPDGGGGYAWSAPVTKACRWQDKQQMVRTATGQEKVSAAVVYLAEGVPFPGKLYRGVSTSSAPPSGSYEILAVAEMVALDGATIGYKVWV